MADRRDDVRSKDRTSTKYAAKKAASQRIAEQRAAQLRQERKRRLMMVGSAVVVVLAVVAALIVVGMSSKKKSTGTANNASPASSTVTGAIATAAKATSASPDLSVIAGPPRSVSGAALKGTSGKPEVLYVGGEFCPNCGATRWPLAVALSRFGTFKGLDTTYSSEGNIPTLSFINATYSSQYVDAVLKEEEDQNHQLLQSLTTSESNLFNTLGVYPGQSSPGYPFVDFAGTWVQNGTVTDYTALNGMTPDAVAQAMTDPTSKVGKDILAAADVYTAIICESTGAKPADVCSAGGVKAAEAKLQASK